MGDPITDVSAFSRQLIYNEDKPGYELDPDRAITMLYAPNMSAANILPNRIDRESTYRYDVDADSNTDLVIGGLLVNTAQIEIDYKDQSGNSIYPVSKLCEPKVSDARVDSLLKIFPNPSVVDLESLYCMAGKSMNIDPVAIPGYIQPRSIMYTLIPGINKVTIIYSSETKPLAGDTDAVDGSQKPIASNGELAETGDNQSSILVTAALVLAIGSGLLISRRAL